MEACHRGEQIHLVFFICYDLQEIFHWREQFWRCDDFFMCMKLSTQIRLIIPFESRADPRLLFLVLSYTPLPLTVPE